MATMTRSRSFDPSIETSQMFAKVFQAYLECSTEVQEAIREMIDIFNSPESTEDERFMASVTIAEALFPSRHDGHLGVDLESVEQRAGGDAKEIQAKMDQEETYFADRITSLLRERGMSQSELAEKIGVGQPAVSMMLARQCRPQRRTVERIACALGVPPADLWPDMSDPG
jgi:lambda repressor-like predicted transcriptional regulator